MRVAIVDDSRTARVAVRLALYGLGWELDEYARCSEFVAHVASGARWDVVVSDVSFGVDDTCGGIAVRDACRAYGIPVVLVHGCVDCDVHELQRRWGVAVVEKGTLERLPAILAKLGYSSS